jgi:hypothetical protein
LAQLSSAIVLVVGCWILQMQMMQMRSSASTGPRFLRLYLNACWIHPDPVKRLPVAKGWGGEKLNYHYKKTAATKHEGPIASQEE